MPEQRLDAYSWQLSGGLRQRAMIAMALSCNPRLLIADEPTTAIDVTTQAQVLRLLRGSQQDRNAAIIFITHDLGVIAQMADDVMVMYLGRVMEQGPGGRDLPRAAAPLHAGAPALHPERALGAAREAADHQRLDPPPLQPAPRLPLPPALRVGHAGRLRRAHPRPRSRSATGSAVSCFLYHDVEVARMSDGRRTAGARSSRCKHLRKYFPIRRASRSKMVGNVRAVDDVSFAVREGETLGLVGESGCGKTTTARCILRAIAADERRDPLPDADGRIVDLATLGRRELRPLRPRCR